MWRRFLAFLAHLLIRLFRSLWRYRYIDRHHSLNAIEDGRPVLYAFFHGQQLMLLGHRNPFPMVQMVSLSKDGDLQNDILHFLGFTTVRGSSGKGGAEALYSMADLVLNGCHAALAVDGSRGPIYQVRRGVLHLARDTEGAIIPVVAAARRSITLKSTWDQYEIPLPFARVVTIEGEPIVIGEDITDEEFESARALLQARLLALTMRAKFLANDPRRQAAAEQEKHSPEKRHGAEKESGENGGSTNQC
jgi:lysophospholipid acyltransferase (LPLAT)-like uncharacterized protein